MCVMGDGWGMYRSWKEGDLIIDCQDKRRSKCSLELQRDSFFPYLLLQIPFLHYTPGPIEWSTIYFMDSPCPSTKPA